MLQSAEKLEERPTLRLVDPETGRKVRLQLRKMTFKEELGKLPDDLKKLHELLVAARNERNSGNYTMVLLWNRMSETYKEFWRDFGFSSEEEYLMYYGLVDGTTLANDTELVHLFDRATFVLLGSSVLVYLVRAIEEWQQNPRAAKRDYQTIFDEYCGKYESFDRRAFFEIVQDYVERRYGREKERKERRLQRERLHVVDVKIQSKNGASRHTAVAHCKNCASKLHALYAFKKYTKALEAIILNELGEKRLPEKPRILKAF